MFLRTSTAPDFYLILGRFTNFKYLFSGENSYLSAVIGAVSEEARTRGVYTEDALRERFIKVDRICKRVSMIGDNGGSLIK